VACSLPSCISVMADRLLTTMCLAAMARDLAEMARLNPHAIFTTYEAFAGLTPKEFRNLVGKPLSHEPLERASLPSSLPAWTIAASINETLDWQERGAVTAVKDQHLDHMYGTCWSFATSGTMEGQEFVASGRRPVDLSPQMLIDCCPQCYGHPDVSLKWLLSEGGQDTQDSYGPYLGRTGTCNQASAIVGQMISSVYPIDEGEDKFLAMLQHGPMHVAIDCTSIDSYKSGVLTHTSCSDPGNHDVLLVGAGEENGVKYWRIKNSWGDWFGEAGYFRVERGTGQLCLGKRNSFGSAATMVTGKPTPLDSGMTNMV